MEVDGITLSEEQQRAVVTILSGVHQFIVLTGDAGTGKSLITRYLKSTGDAAVTATTGRAGLLIGGRTIDSEWGFNRTSGQLFRQSKWQAAIHSSPPIMMIDEGSMITHQMARIIHRTAVAYSKTVVVVCDWAQASPVVTPKDEKDIRENWKEYDYLGEDVKWPFESPLFQDAHIIKLQHVHRQSDPLFLSVLNKIRRGVIDQEVEETMRTRVWTGDQSYLQQYIKLYARNREALAYNMSRLNEHCLRYAVKTYHLIPSFIEATPERVSRANEERVMRWGSAEDREEYERSGYCDLCKEPAGKTYSTQEINRIMKDSQLSESTIAKGSKVLLTYNDPDKQYVNGDTGIVSGVQVRDDGSPRSFLVQLDRGLEVTITSIDIEVTDMKDRILYWVRGWPIRLGWAMTIHKSQGMTADYVWLSMESILGIPPGGRHGLAYVGLSRCKSLDRLYISRWVPEAVETSQKVREWL